MNDKMNYKYCTYKFYAEDGRRIAAFAEETDKADKLKVTLIYCSKQDQFSKQGAKKRFASIKNSESIDFNTSNYFKNSAQLQDWLIINGLLTHPETFEITVNPKTPKKDFIGHMFNNYYVKREKTVKCWVETLEGPKGIKVISKPKQIFKMDKAW